MGNNFIGATITLIVFTFLVVIFYFTISPFVTSFFIDIDEADTGAANSEIDELAPMYQTVFNICIALALAIAPTWFITWVYSREPQWGYRRY